MKAIGTLTTVSGIFIIDPSGNPVITQNGLVKVKTYGTYTERRPKGTSTTEYQRRQVETLSLIAGPVNARAVSNSGSFRDFRQATSMGNIGIQMYEESNVTGAAIPRYVDWYYGPWKVEAIIATHAGDGTATVDIDLRQEYAWEDDA